MATKEKPVKAKERITQLPDMIDHRKIADKLGIDPETVRNWVTAGEWPLPHTTSGTLYFYRLDDFKRWSDGEGWPETVRFRQS